MQTLYIINGHPCTGKTTFAQKASEKYDVPLFTKDAYKEIIFDTVGWSDREYSTKVGIAAWHILYQTVGQVLSTGASAMIEANFTEYSRTEIQGCIDRSSEGINIIEVFFHTKQDVLLARFRERAFDPEQRHPGHADDQAIGDALAKIAQPSQPLRFSSNVIEVDTTDFTQVEYREIYRAIDEV